MGVEAGFGQAATAPIRAARVSKRCIVQVRAGRDSKRCGAGHRSLTVAALITDAVRMADAVRKAQVLRTSGSDWSLDEGGCRDQSGREKESRPQVGNNLGHPARLENVVRWAIWPVC